MSRRNKRYMDEIARQTRLNNTLARLSTRSPGKAEALTRRGVTLHELENFPVGSSAVFTEPEFEWPLVAMKVSPGLWVGTRGHWRSAELAQRDITLLGGIGE